MSFRRGPSRQRWSLPLPTGAATGAKQDALLAALGAPYQAGGALPLPAGAATAINQLGNVAYAGTTTPLAAAATRTGVTRDSGALIGSPGIDAYFNAFFTADQPGTAYIDGSDDGTNWTIEASQPLAAGTPVLLTVPVLFKFHRDRYVNGATAQTVFVAKSSYTAG